MEKTEEHEHKKTHEEQKKHTPTKSPNVLLWAMVFIIGVIVVIMGLRFIFPQHPSYPTMTYNGYTFQEIDNLWYTHWQHGENVYTVSLRFNPAEVENVSVSGQLDERFNKQEIYLTFDPLEGNFTYQALAAAELSLNLHRALGLMPIAACTQQDNDACLDRPIITCDNTNSSVILIKDDPGAKLVLNGNCMIIQGEGLEKLRVVDRVLYQWYRILKDDQSLPVLRGKEKTFFATTTSKALAAYLNETVFSVEVELDWNPATGEQNLVMVYATPDDNKTTGERVQPILAAVQQFNVNNTMDISNVVILEIPVFTGEGNAGEIAWADVESGDFTALQIEPLAEDE